MSGELPDQWRRRMRALRRDFLRQARYDREHRLDHHVARQLALTPPNVGGEVHNQCEQGDYHEFVNCTYRYCGSVAIWVGYAPRSNIFECRVEGYPTVSDIAMHVRNPSSTKALTRAARYALMFLEQQLGTPVFGTLRLADGETYDVRVSAPASRG